MIQGILIFEDTVIGFSTSDEPDKDYRVVFGDNATGKQEVMHLTNIEFGATLLLTTGAAEDDVDLGTLYYHVKYADKLPPELRPFP